MKFIYISKKKYRKNPIYRTSRYFTFLEIIKTTLINTVYFLLLTVFGNAVSKNMNKIKAGLTIARLRKIWRENEEEKR